MVGLLIHYMAPIMFAALVVFLLLGYPVAFSLAAVGLIFGVDRHRARPVPAATSCRRCRSASTAS